MIASFVAIMPTRPAQRQAPAVERLAEMLDRSPPTQRRESRRRECLQTAGRCRCCSVFLAAASPGSAPTSSLLDQHLVEIVGSRCRARASLPTAYLHAGRRRRCWPARCIALLPELGRMSRKQVAALVGVAPYDFESGKLKGRRCIWGGRAPVRQRALHGGDERLQLESRVQEYSTIVSRPPANCRRSSIVAVMRKMITTLNAMVRDDVGWADRLTGRHSVPTAR